MGIVRYVTHPEVVVDPTTPVPQWHLSERGRTRIQRMLGAPWMTSVGRVVSSAETKALEAAGIVAAHRGLDVEVRAATGELDRTVPGFLPPAAFERVADACFAEPGASAAGWERAIDAQARIGSALADLLDVDEQIVVIGHGGVGTLWYCALAAVPIARRWDQPGQGHFFTVVDGRPVHAWRSIDDPEVSVAL